MSLTDSILSNTVGLAWRGFSGTVDPWTLANQKEDAAAQTAQALGSSDVTTYGPVDPAVVAAETAKTQAAMDADLRETGTHPDQAGFRIPGLGNIGSAEFLQKVEHVVYGLLLIGGLLGAAYFSYHYRRTLKDLVK